MDIYESFRQLYGISHTQAAKVLKIDPSTVRRWKIAGAIPEGRTEHIKSLMGHNKRTREQIKKVIL